MRTRFALLLITLLFLISIPCHADSAVPTGYYNVSGEVTILGTVTGPCGSSPCVENLDFSFQMLVTPLGPDPSGNQLYKDSIIGGPGVYSASGPIGGLWTAEIIPGYTSVDDGFVFGSNAMPEAVIDAVGFNYPDGIPHSIDGPLAFFYACYDDINKLFGCQSTTDPGTENILVQKTPEPNAIVLMLITGLGVLLIAFAKGRFTIRPYS